MATRYWVGGAGDWTPTDTGHWSSSSGGAGGASVPTSADDVIFNSASGSGNYTVRLFSGPANCNNIGIQASCGATVYAAYGNYDNLNVYGNIEVDSTATGKFAFLGPGVVNMCASSGTKYINLNGKSSGDMSITGGASYVLSSDWTGGQADEGTTLTVSSGSLDINGKTLRVDFLTLTGYAQVLFTGGGTAHIGNHVGYNNGALSVAATASYDAAKLGTTTLQSGSYNATTTNATRYGTLKIYPVGSGAQCLIPLPANTEIVKLIIDMSAASYLYAESGVTLSAIGTTKIQCLEVVKGDSTYSVLKSTTSGSRAAVSTVGPYKLRATSLYIKDINVASGSPIYAASSCVNGGNNLNVLFGKVPPGFGAML